MNTHPWQKLESNLVHQNPWCAVRHDSVIRPDGTPGDYYVVEMNHPGVLIVPFDGERFYLVRQYRYAIGDNIWAFPAGHGSSTQPLEDAKRELKEETGFEAKTWNELGTMALAPGWSAATVRAFLATDLTNTEINREASESDMRMQGFTFIIGQIWN